MNRSDRERSITLLVTLNARATGMWRVVGNELVQTSFEAAEDLADEIARGFADSTRRVSLDRTELGIVKAVLNRGTAVSVASELPPEIGSGYWLRAFGASRSIAVALANPDGSIFGVLSAAVSARPESDEELAEIVRCIGTAHLATHIDERE